MRPAHRFRRRPARNKRVKSRHGVSLVTPAGRSVYYDLFSPEEAVELEVRSVLLLGLKRWLSEAGKARTKAARVLGITRRDISEIRRGGINRFPLGLLVRLVTRVGLRFTITVAP